MEVTNFSWRNKVVKRENSPLLPSSIRGLIVGRSNSGKTVLLYNLLLKDGWLDYDNLLVFGNSLFQPEYEIIKTGFENNLGKKQILSIFESQDQLPNPIETIENYNG
jgi:ABC-type glutathione transport system ATPase component